MRNKWQSIPSDVHVLITYGPPPGILDFTVDGKNAGSTSLPVEISERIKPQLHLFGHIHEGHGIRRMDDPIFVNGSICNSQLFVYSCSSCS